MVPSANFSIKKKKDIFIMVVISRAFLPPN